MRLTINLEDDLYAVARSLARESNSSISAALNKLIRKSLNPPTSDTGFRIDTLTGLPVVSCRRIITSEDVARIEEEEDLQKCGS